jgi:hypothetical protein
MAGFSASAPPCMVAGPNGLDLKKIQMRVKFKSCFKFGLKKIRNLPLWLCLVPHEIQNVKCQLLWYDEMQNAKIFMGVFSSIQNAKILMG